MSSVYSAFNTDAAGLVPSLKRDKKVKDREIVRTLVPPNQHGIISYNDSQEDEDKLPIYMINPEFELYYSQGYRSPKNHPNLGSYPGPISFPAPYKLTSEVISQVTDAGSFGDSTMRQLSPDPDMEHEIQKKYGAASSIFLPEIRSVIAPGLKDNLAKIAETGSLPSYQSFLNDSTITFPNFRMEDDALNISFETLLAQDISTFAAGGSTAQELEEFLKGTGREDLGAINASSLGPSRWFIRYNAQGTTGLLEEFYSVNFFTINDEGREINLANAIDANEELNPQALEVIRREGLWEPELAVQQVSHDQFAYGPSTAGGPAPGTGTQELQFSQFADKAFTEGSIIRKPGDSESYDRIGGASNLGILQGLLLDQRPNELRTLYVEIFRDFMTAFSSEISRSDLFEEGVLDLANLTPKLTQRQILEDCKDPHLLDLETIKKIIENEYAITKCIENVLSQEDGLGTGAKNALEKALLGGAVIVTIRLYALEVVLKTIFAFAEFNFSEETDIPKLISIFIERKIVNETRKLGYSQNFVHECLESYNRLANLSETIDIASEPTTAFDYYIRREMMVVQRKMNTILGTKEDTTINSVLSEGFIRCFDVPSASGELRLSLDKIQSLSKQGEMERGFLNSGLSEDAIAKREDFSELDSPYKFQSLVRSLSSDDDTWLEGRPGWKTQYSRLISTQFNFTPILRGPAAINTANAAVALGPSTLNVWDPMASPEQTLPKTRPLGYDGLPIKTTAQYDINAGAYTGRGDRNHSYYATYSGQWQGINNPSYYTIYNLYIDLSYENTDNPDAWTKTTTTQQAVGWDEIVENPWDRDSSNKLINAPPQFIAELWPFFTFALAQEPNQQIGVNYNEIYPNYGFDDVLSQSLAPNKTGYFQLFRPSGQFSEALPEWFTDGLNNERWWSEDTSVFERDALITMFEIFNNQNILLPGNAGASYTRPTSRSVIWNPTPEPEGVDPNAPRQGDVSETLYELVELPSPTYSRTMLWPVLYNRRFHKLDWQHGLLSHTHVGGGAGHRKPTFMDPAADAGFYRRYPTATTPYEISTFSNDMKDVFGDRWNPTIFNSRADDQRYRIYKNSDLPIPPTADPITTPDGAPFLVEYSFHPKMLDYTIQDATIDKFPEDIQKEIDYYESWRGLDDRDLLRELRRQFISNRTQFRLSYTMNNKLLKIGEELLQNKWNGRAIPSPDFFGKAVKRIYSGMAGRLLPENEGKDYRGIRYWEETTNITVQTTVGGAPSPHREEVERLVTQGYWDYDNTNFENKIDSSDWNVIRTALGATLPWDTTGNQTHPRAYQDNLGLRGDVTSQGFDKPYTLIYILDQIRSRLRNLRGEVKIRKGFNGGNLMVIGYFQEPHTYQTYVDDNINTGGGYRAGDQVQEQAFRTLINPYANPRRDHDGWVPGAGSPNSHWPPYLELEHFREIPRVPYTKSQLWDNVSNLPSRGWTETNGRPAYSAFAQVFNEVKQKGWFWYDGNLDTGLEAPYDDPEIFGQNQQWSDSGWRADAHAQYKWMFLQLWELDFWMNKLTAFMLLEPSFEDYRSFKDYPEFLKRIKGAAEHIRDQFRKDLNWRKKEAKRIRAEIGDVYNSRQPKGNILTMFMDNGGLIYEKYIRLIEKDWTAIKVRLAEATQTGRMDAAQYNQATTQLQDLKDASEKRDNWLKGAVNIEAFQSWLEQYKHLFVPSYNPALEPPQSMEPSRVIIGPTTPADECGEDLLDTHLPTEDLTRWTQVLSLNELFEEARFGFRITAVVAPNANPITQKVKDDYLTNFTPGNPLVRQQGNPHVRNNGAGSPLIRQAQNLLTLTEMDKAYFLQENGQYFKDDIDDGLPGQTVVVKDEYVTIPLVSVELPIDPNMPLEDLMGIHKITTPLSSDVLEVRQLTYLYNQKLPTLLSTLRETDEFKFLFKYCFPVDRMFSLNLMYILLYLGQLPNVDKTFNNTKQTLKTVFNAFLNSGNYQYESDITNQTLDKYDMANPGDSPGVDLWSIAGNFALMAFRAITEMTDPNIQLSRFIYSGLEASVSAANSVFGGECSTGVEIPPGTFFAISWGLLPINIFGPFGYGPPITPQGIVYDVVFGIVDPLASSAVKNNQRCLAKKAGGRDFTNAIECNDEEDQATSAAAPNIPYTNEDDFAAGLVDKDGNPIPPEEQPPSSISAGPKYKGHVVSYIDDQGRRRDKFGRVIGDDGNLYDVDGNPWPTS
jgi:hypothetical protein